MEAQLAAAPPPHLSEDIWAEILARLPVKSVLRFRAVCKAWRDITTRPLFLAANARQQPAKVVLYTYLDSPQRGYAAVDDVALDVLPVSGETAADPRRRLIRYPRSEPPSSMNPLLLGSCDGVLLFRKDAAAGTYFLCNPVTRRWAELPALPDDEIDGHGHRRCNVREYAFYFHQQSGEFRLLCGRLTSAAGGRRTWCILSTGADEPRHVDVHAAAADDDDLVEPDAPSETTPVAFHDSMHWAPRRPRASPPPPSSSKQETATSATEMVAFDVRSEKFRRMAGPRTATRPLMMKLFVMDGLLLAAADFGQAQTHVDLWFLVDYAGGRWVRRHRVPTPWQSVSNWGYNKPNSWSTAAACDGRGNVMLGSLRRGLFVYDVRTKTVRVRDDVNSVATPTNIHVVMSRYVFRESLVEHPHFKSLSSTTDLPLIHFWC